MHPRTKKCTRKTGCLRHNMLVKSKILFFPLSVGTKQHFFSFINMLLFSFFCFAALQRWFIHKNDPLLERWVCADPRISPRSNSSTSFSDPQLYNFCFFYFYSLLKRSRHSIIFFRVHIQLNIHPVQTKIKDFSG